MYVCSVMSNSSQPHELSWPGSSFHAILLGENTGVYCHFPLRGYLPIPAIEPSSPTFPALAGGFFTNEPPGKT